MSIKLTKINRMYALSFLFTLHISLSAYVNSTFLVKIISEKYVGLLYTIAAIVTIIMLSLSSKILQNFGNRRLIISFLIINMLALFLLIFSNEAWTISVSFISMIVTNTLIYLCLDIFIEHFGKKDAIGKTRGTYLTVTNLAWMLSPLVTALLITEDGGYVAVYIVALVTVTIMTLWLFFYVREFKDKNYKRTPFVKTYKFLKTNRHILAVTMINFVLQFFFALMVVYTPIYLNKHIGFEWDQIGIIFTIMLAPFVIFGLPVGILIDKYHVRKRKLLLLGFLIVIVSTLSISFINLKSIVLWSFILFMTRTGASIIETTSEIYFFTHTKEEDAYLLGVFRDMTPISYIVAPLIATLIFIFFPFKYLFLGLSIIMLGGIYYIPHLVHEQKDENRIPD